MWNLPFRLRHLIWEHFHDSGFSVLKSSPLLTYSTNERDTYTWLELKLQKLKYCFLVNISFFYRKLHYGIFTCLRHTCSLTRCFLLSCTHYPFSYVYTSRSYYVYSKRVREYIKKKACFYSVDLFLRYLLIRWKYYPLPNFLSNQ